MRTDKQLCLIFEANPEWLFELTGLPSPGPCRFQSVSLKAIEQTADGVVIPDAADEVVTILEIQFQRDDEIYFRVVLEMVLVQQKMRGRRVQGVILFADETLDPRIEPWCNIVTVYSLLETIGRFAVEHPEHPLVAVFQPLLAKNVEKLEREAAGCYNRIASSELAEPLKSVLLSVFVNWLEQRFVNKGKAEIEEMLFGQLPDLQDTQSGKDLIAIGFQEGIQVGIEQGIEKGIEKGIEQGIEQGIEKGKRDALTQVLAIRFGQLDSMLVEKIEELSGTEMLDKYFSRALEIDSLAQLFTPE